MRVLRRDWKMEMVLRGCSVSVGEIEALQTSKKFRVGEGQKWSSGIDQDTTEASVSVVIRIAWTNPFPEQV